MTIDLPLWAIPAVLTAVACLWPTPRPRGDYDFSVMIFAAIHGAAAVVATLFVWFVFFIIV